MPVERLLQPAEARCISVAGLARRSMLPSRVTHCRRLSYAPPQLIQVVADEASVNRYQPMLFTPNVQGRIIPQPTQVEALSGGEPQDREVLGFEDLKLKSLPNRLQPRRPWNDQGRTGRSGSRKPSVRLPCVADPTRRFMCK